MTAALLALADVRRSDRLGTGTVQALRDVHLRLWPGGIVAVTGPSGSGKSTRAGTLTSGGTGARTAG